MEKVDACDAVFSIRIGDQDGVTPVFIAAENYHVGVLELLIKGGADVNKANQANTINILSCCPNALT